LISLICNKYKRWLCCCWCRSRSDAMWVSCLHDVSWMAGIQWR